jgi:two-component system response regulator YesN
MWDLAGLNAFYFGSLFKRETGLSMCQFLARIRVKNAEKMLLSGDYKNAEEVAYGCGYADVFHFYKQFKAVKGLPFSRWQAG